MRIAVNSIINTLGMKQCPTCGTNYADDTLRFCLEDGTPLVKGFEQPTVIRPGDQGSYKTEKLPSNITTPGFDAMRVDIPPADKRTSPITVPPSGAGFPWLKLIVAVLAIGFVVVLGAGLLGVAFYVGSGNNKDQSELKTASPTPVFTPAATPANDKQKLEEEVANLKKKIEESSGSNSDKDDVPFDLGDISLGGTAEVNSPKDGFLALRNLPNVDLGTRIAKIPHSATIKIIMCSDDAVTIDTRTGHWCMVSYNEQVGWIFDAWIIKSAKK